MNWKNVKLPRFGNKKQVGYNTLFGKLYWNVFYPVYSFFLVRYNKLKKIKQYAVYLWNVDRDFDYAYIFQLLNFKLERMKRLFADSPYTTQEDTVEQIEYVQKLIEDYLEKDFIKEEREELESKYQWIDRWEKLEESGDYLWLVDFKEGDIVYKAGSKKATEIEGMYANLHKIYEQRKEECKNEIFYYLADHIEFWWD